MWAPGDRVVLRFRNDGRNSHVQPVTVVEDSSRCLALYMALGTTVRLPVGIDGAPVPRALSYEERRSRDWRLGTGRWRDTHVLWLVRPGAAHAWGVFWRGDWSFLGWYLDLLEPLRRTDVGFETVDHVLDVRGAPDLTWRWKDEDEFAAALRLGRFSPDEALTIRGEAEIALKAVAVRSWPFDAGWERWRPDPSWTIPDLPSGWDQD